jgi:predicted nucleic acid-binding protein
VTVVSNSGPLINLAKVGWFTLLRDVFQHILIPIAVFEEVTVRGNGQPGATETRSAHWITRRTLRQPDIANILTAELDRGEAESIALALQEKADWPLIDERTGRRFAMQTGLRVKGTLGILVDGVRRGHIEDLQPVLDELIGKGTWIAPAIYTQVVALGQEARRAHEEQKRQ